MARLANVTASVALVTAMTAWVPSPLWAQNEGNDSSSAAKLLVHPGAVVRVKAPSLGSSLFLGKFATARVRGAICLGAAVNLPGSDGSPSLILLKGISQLEVDRRTNQNAVVLNLEPPGPDDWEKIDLDALRAQDRACPVQGKPAG